MKRSIFLTGIPVVQLLFLFLAVFLNIQSAHIRLRKKGLLHVECWKLLHWSHFEEKVSVWSRALFNPRDKSNSLQRPPYWFLRNVYLVCTYLFFKQLFYFYPLHFNTNILHFQNRLVNLVFNAFEGNWRLFLIFSAYHVHEMKHRNRMETDRERHEWGEKVC